MTTEEHAEKTNQCSGKEFIGFKPRSIASGKKARSVTRTNELIIEDENGKPRAALRVDKDIGGPILVLGDENGKTCAQLAVVKGSPAIYLYDENGKGRLAVCVSKVGPSLSLFDENGKHRALLRVSKNKPWLELLDEKEKVIWQVPPPLVR